MDLIIRVILEWWLCILLAFETIVQECEKLKRIRRWWVRPHLKDNLKERYGAYATIFQYFKLHDHEEFYAFVGMTVNQFDYLHRLVHPILLKRSFRHWQLNCDLLQY